MNAVIDELWVYDAGTVDVRIIPPDEVSRMPDALVTFSAGSSPALTIIGRDLPAIAAALGARGRIEGLVHGGEDIYTFKSSAGESIEVTLDSRPDVALIIQRIADAAFEAEFGKNQAARVSKPRWRSRKPAVR
jgi:hypothetical protein